MIIELRGPWKSEVKADLLNQLGRISDGAETYHGELEIPLPVRQRIAKSYAMEKYFVKCENQVNAWVAGLYGKDKQLLTGKTNVMMTGLNVLPALDVAPPLVEEGIWHFIEGQRDIWMKHENYNEGVGDAMSILGPIRHFDTDLYTPEVEINVMTGVIKIVTDSAIITKHNFYCGTFGINPLPLIISFDGAKYSYHRTLPSGVTSENLGVQLQGIYKNELIGNISPVVKVAYNG